MASKDKGKPMSGGAKLKASGRLAIMITVDPTDKVKIEEAAALEMRPVSQFVAYHAILAAEERLLAARTKLS
jgi:uncharacterized protein (DUF1778 family)